MDELPKFEKWERKELDAYSYAQLAIAKDMFDRIQQLQCDLKTAIEAYRNLLRKMQDGTDDWK